MSADVCKNGHDLDQVGGRRMSREPVSDVRKAANAWKAARDREEAARQALIGVVQRCHAAGDSEYYLASEAGVSRGTIRVWLGKGPK